MRAASDRRKLSPAEVEEISPRYRHVVEGDPDEPETEPETRQAETRQVETRQVETRQAETRQAETREAETREGAGDEPDEIFEEFMALTQWTFDEPPRKLTHDEKLEIWERRRRVRRGA